MRAPLALFAFPLFAAPLALVTAGPAGPAPQGAADDAARLKSSATLGKFELVTNEAYPPVRMLFQRPGPNYGVGFEDNMVKLHGPWLQRATENFDAQYAQPNGLRRRAERPAPTIVVLWTLQDYAPYLKVAPEPNGFSETAHYDRELGVIVTFEYGAPVQAPHWRRLPELAQLVRAELDAYAKDGATRVPHWVAEGLSSYLASHEGADLGALDKHFVDKQLVQKVVLTMHDYGIRNSTLLPLRELFAPKSYQEQRAALIKKGGPAVEKLIKPKDMQMVIHGQAWALVAFLHEAEGGKYRAPFVQYVGSALNGDGGFDAFQRCYKGFDLGALEADAYKWLFDLYHVQFPGAKADPAALKGMGAPPGSPEAKAAEPKPVNFAELLDLDIPALHAGVLHEIRSGHIQSAITQLEALRAKPKVGEHAVRLEREIVRCKKFAALRDKHIAALAAANGKLNLEYEGKKLAVKVKGTAEGKVFLEENRAKIAFVYVEDLDPVELAKSMDKALGEGPDGWARWYPAVLAGDTKVLKSLKGSEGADALHKDADEWYPGALQTGEAIALMVRIAQAGEPADAAAAQKSVDALQQLVQKYGKLELVKARTAVLKEAATAAYKVLWDPSKGAETTAGKFEALPDGRVRLTYEFDKKEEAAEFTADHKYFEAWRQSLTSHKFGPAPELEVARGALRLRGAACWRHGWTFSEPLSVKYDVSFDGVDEDPARTPLFAVGLCDDRKESFVWSQGFGSLFANDKRTRYTRSDANAEGREIMSGVDYSLEVAVAGGKAVTREGGTQLKQIDGVPHKGGEVFLYVHTDPFVVFSRIVIEGKPDPDALRAAWIARKLGQLQL